MEECGLNERREAQPKRPPLNLEILDHLRHNCRIKTYPDGSASVLVADRRIFREPGWVEIGKKPDKDAQRLWEALEDAAPEACELSQYALARQEDEDRERAAASLDRAQRRARNAVQDLALSNDFRYFVTLTLDAKRVDRYDVREVTRKLNNWLDNCVRRHGLVYVLVPELHKDGAIHFHGLFNGALPMEDSGTIDRGKGKPMRPRSAAERERWLAAGGHIVYNLPAWTLGFTTAIALYGERRAAVGYVCKYISKQQRADGSPGKIGGRWYYSGGALQRPRVTYCDIESGDFDALTGHEFRLEELGVRCKIFETEAAGNDDYAGGHS